jgi:hypothetical protein
MAYLLFLFAPIRKSIEKGNPHIREGKQREF